MNNRATEGSIGMTIVMAQPTLNICGPLTCLIHPYPNTLRVEEYVKRFFGWVIKKDNLMSKFATAYGQIAELKIAELTYYDILNLREWI